MSAVGAPNDQTKKKSAEEKPREEQIANQVRKSLIIKYALFVKQVARNQ